MAAPATLPAASGPSPLLQRRHSFAVLLLASFLISAPLAAQEPKDPLAAEWQRFSSQLLTACPVPSTTNLDELLKAERDQSFAVRRKTSDATGWFALGCIRSRLFALDGIAREGLQMPPGSSWADGALSVVLEGLKRDNNPEGAELLGILVQDVFGERVRRSAATALGRAVESGVRGRFALRGCSALRWRAGDRAGSVGCSTTALAAGIDSTWHLLNLARMAFAEGDTAGGEARMLSAVTAIRDAEDRRAMDWHLRWFLEPEELTEWRTLTGNRTTWVRDLFAERDLRDGRPAGARMAAHFARLANIDTMFRVTRTLQEARRFELAATPENRIGAGWVAKWTGQDPAGVPARPFRFFRRTHPEYDDRAEVWMRWGEPDERHHSFPTARVEDRGPNGRRNNPCQDKDVENPEYGFDRCLPAGDHSNVREGWLYRLGERSVLVSFEGEDFDGTAEATRLVAGVLGFYLCGLETSRCNLTNRSTSPAMPELAVETVTGLAQSDEALIEYATTADANVVMPESPIALVATPARVWVNEGHEVVTLVPYAAKTSDLVQQAPDGAAITLRLEYRRWESDRGRFATSVRDQPVTLSGDLARDSHVTGTLVFPGGGGAGSWALALLAGAGEGHAWGKGMPGLSGTVAMSDLVLGQASQDQQWTAPTGTTVPLGPLGAFALREPVSLFWQVRSDATRTVQVQMALERTDRRNAPGLQVAFQAEVAAGVNEFLRELDVTRLEAGSYLMRVTVAVPSGEVTMHRTAPVLLW